MFKKRVRISLLNSTLSPAFTFVSTFWLCFSQCKKSLHNSYTSGRFLLTGIRSESTPSHLQTKCVSALSCIGNSFAAHQNKLYKNQCLCHGAVKAFISLVWMFSPPRLLPSPPVVCVHVFLPFVLWEVFIKAVISKLPFTKTKQLNTNIRKQHAGRALPAAAPGEAAATAQRDSSCPAPPAGPPAARPLSFQLRCHPFYKPHDCTQLCVSLGMSIQSVCV